MKGFWVCIVLLVAIHTFDMVVTDRCIGDDWEREMFFPMRLAIHYIGIYNALWVSRLLTYLYLLFCIHNREQRLVRSVLYTVTVLYWTSMLSWPYFFGWFNWP